MWWVGSKGADVYLGTRAFAVCKREEAVLVQPTEDLAQSLARLAAWLPQSGTRAARLWLSGGLCRPMLLQPVEGIAGDEEWRRVAQSMVGMQTGWTAPSEVWVERAAAGTPRIAVAVQQALLAQLQELAGAHRLRWSHIGPWWGDGLRAALQMPQRGRVLAVRDCDSLTLLGGDGAQFDLATTYAPVVDADAADAALSRMLMSSDATPDQVWRITLSTASLATRDAGEVALAPLVEWAA